MKSETVIGTKNAAEGKTQPPQEKLHADVRKDKVEHQKPANKPATGVQGKNKPWKFPGQKIAYPRLSLLTKDEQKTYLELYERYTRQIPQKPSLQETRDINTFKVE